MSSSGPYRLLETVRAYACEQLERTGTGADARDAHASFYVGLAENAEAELAGPRQLEWFDRISAERPNLYAAMEWLLARGQSELALRLVSALVLFWRVRGPYSEGRELLQAALAGGDGEPRELRAKALWGAGFLTSMAGDASAAIPLLQQSLHAYRAQGHDQGCARVLLLLADAGLVSISCPATNQFTALDIFGYQATFDPATPSTVNFVQIDTTGNNTAAVACLSANECVGTDTGGYEVTFDPTATSTPTASSILPNGSLGALVCLSASSCVATDGSLGAVAFDPIAPSTATDHIVQSDQQPPAGRGGFGRRLSASRWRCLPDDDAVHRGRLCRGRADVQSHGPERTGARSGRPRWRCELPRRSAIPNAAGTSDAATSSQTAVVVRSGGGGGSPPSSPPPPELTGLSLTHSVFAVASTATPLSATAAARPKGTVFKYTLNEAATVRIVISGRLPGRKRGHRCVAPTRKLRHAKAFTRTVKSGTLTRASHQGANAVAFSGRLGFKPLKPGRYKAVITATNSAGEKSSPRTISFTIVER